MFAPSPTQSDALKTLRLFLVGILPSSVVVLQSQANRAAEPHADDFVLMTPTFRQRLATNIDTYNDCQFTGSIAGLVLTVSAVAFGTITVGNTLFGTGVAANTVIGAQATGTPGGVGTYAITPTQTLTSRKLASGVQYFLQPTNFHIQLDVHGPASAENAQTISTLMRDEYSTSAFYALNPNVSPLFADDPRQLPFLNDQNQYENRWVISAQVQVSATVTVPFQFADQIDTTLIPVDNFYAA